MDPGAAGDDGAAVIRVLVVEDEPVAAAAHAAYVERLPGFTCLGAVDSGRAALAFVQSTPVDLLLLDLTLTDGHGLQVVRALRAAGSGVDVIAITAARDLAVVRSAVALGVVQYLLKPFTYAAFRDKLLRYAEFGRATGGGSALDQSEVDRALGTLRGSTDLPKGLSPSTLDLVVTALQEADGEGLSAAEVAGRAGTSRVTARRYLEHLVEARGAVRGSRYGGAGRPETEYRRAPS